MGTTIIINESITDVLKAEDVEYLVGLPSNPLFGTEIPEDAEIRTIITRQGRTALHMADGIGRASSGENIAAFVCQPGPGTEKSVENVGCATQCVPRHP
ncbi:MULTISPECIES: thiamine pyrophosphate-binding protein [Halococcus]|uniref:thiamine pyrophosphate-binding protein n=1 Tax=Halococcus TaxID=2249 RepID=UPI001F4CD16A|nr:MULTISPECIES: thiamine pyrophosphate-binding protein [Halococcus]